jgi:hypothetical protein
LQPPRAISDFPARNCVILIWYIKIPPWLRLCLRFPQNWPVLGLTRTSFQRGPLLSPSLLSPLLSLLIDRLRLLSSLLFSSIFPTSYLVSNFKAFIFLFLLFSILSRHYVRVLYLFPDSWILNLPHHSSRQQIVDLRVHFVWIKVRTLQIVAFESHFDLIVIVQLRYFVALSLILCYS